MSDDISIPHAEQARTEYVHSYRSRRTRLDRGTRGMILAAGGIVVALVGGTLAWRLLPHRSGEVPLIQADSRPLRVKPTDPASTPISALVDANATAANTDLAPQAERPDPQALLAQRQRPASDTPPPPPPAAATALTTETARPAPPASVSPQLAAPQLAAPPVAAPPVATPQGAAPSARVPAGAGRVMVQLAAVDSEAGAASEWQRLSRRMPDLLGGRQSVVQKAEQGGHAIWRVRTGGFDTIADATQFCQKVKAKGGGCSLATF